MKRMIAILLLLTLSLSMWGCSSSNSNLNQPSNIDPNGFSSLDELAGAYVAMQTCSITKEQYRKCFPESHWEDTDIEQQYSAMCDHIPVWQEIIKKYGNNFNVSYKIVSKEVTYDGSNSNYTSSENEKHISIYGVSIKERMVYAVSIILTLKGSAMEETQSIEFSCVKIANKWYADDNMTS